MNNYKNNGERNAAKNRFGRYGVVITENNSRQPPNRVKKSRAYGPQFWIGWAILFMTGIHMAIICVSGLNNHLDYLERQGIPVILSVISAFLGILSLLTTGFVYLFRNKEIRYSIAIGCCGLNILIMLASDTVYLALRNEILAGIFIPLFYNISEKYASSSIWIILTNIVAIAVLCIGRKRSRS